MHFKEVQHCFVHVEQYELMLSTNAETKNYSAAVLIIHNCLNLQIKYYQENITEFKLCNCDDVLLVPILYYFN